jgi:uncharacterized protein YvpB
MKKFATLVSTFVIGMAFVGCSNTGRNASNVTETTTVTAGAVTKTPETTVKETTTTTATQKTTTTTTTATTTIPTTKATEVEAKTTKLAKLTVGRIKVEKTEEQTTTIAKVDPLAVKRRVQLYVKNIQQVPELPMGCEAVSGSIALQWYGFKVDKYTLLKYQPMDEAPENGVWGDPNEVFVGNPRTYKWGCYSPVIKKAIEDYFEANKVTGYEVVSLDGSEFTDLYSEIDAGNPIILWVTTWMQDLGKGESWKLKDGSTFTWTLHEHCVVLIGYDTERDTVLISDPYDPKGTVEYSRKKVERVYKQLNNMALVIHKK